MLLIVCKADSHWTLPSHLPSPQSCNLFLQDLYTFVLHSTRKFDPSAEVQLNSSHTIFTHCHHSYWSHIPLPFLRVPTGGPVGQILHFCLY